jgi:hypothetical protein
MAALISLLGLQAVARLGENQTQFSTRYGAPLEDKGRTNTTRSVEMNCTKTYESQGWRLKARFVNGLAERVDYSKSVARYSDQEIQAILQAEAAGGRWHSLNTRPWGSWTNSNGSTCERTSLGLVITVTSASARQRDAAEKAGRNKPAPAPKF